MNISLIICRSIMIASDVNQRDDITRIYAIFPPLNTVNIGTISAQYHVLINVPFCPINQNKLGVIDHLLRR